MDHDQSLETFRLIAKEFRAFRDKTEPTEADTRANLISRIIHEVLDWPRDCVTREESLSPGYIDYALKTHRPLVVLEAKKNTESWRLAENLRRRIYKLSGVVSSVAELNSAIIQVQRYAVDTGAPYAIATTGECWIAFRALRIDGIPWKNGLCTLFRNMDDIEDNFISFIELFSFENLRDHSLKKKLRGATDPRASYHRVIEELPDKDARKIRNRIHTRFIPVMRRFYSELRSLEDVENCYVSDKDLEIVDRDIEHSFRDIMPEFLRLYGAVRSKTRKDSTLSFVHSMSAALSTERPSATFLICGGIGCGKTTFLRRLKAKSTYDGSLGSAVWMNFEFTEAPSDIRELEGYVLSELRSQLVAEQSIDLSTDQALFEVFEDDLRADGLVLPASGAPNSAIRHKISRYMKVARHYVKSAARHCLKNKRVPVIVFDNVDQLDHEYQQAIFLHAQYLAKTLPSVVIVAMREESFYSTVLRRALTAYRNTTFHLPSPSLEALLWLRWQYSRSKLGDSQFVDSELSAVPGDFPTKDVLTLLNVAHRTLSGQSGSHPTRRFLESLCYGNMRLALQMFSTFLSSGYLEVDKILAIERDDRRGNYRVAEHEFAKTILLGDHKYYSGARSHVWNLFEISNVPGASHFSCLRILNSLAAHRTTFHSEGMGFCELRTLSGSMEDVFGSSEDGLMSMKMMLRKGLIEVDTRSTETVDGASLVRITPAGSFYSSRLVHKFVYLDLVLQDTPICRDQVVSSLARSLKKSNGESLPERFSRVDEFLEYLSGEESREFDEYELQHESPPWNTRLVPWVREQYALERDYIQSRMGLS
ncbi:MAG: hypothetical protein ACTSV8_05800 [Candidatus Thorarchaeota archaeon]